MTPETDRIQHVSDTALLVAACRALETGREYGFVSDPFAEKLAGARGMALAHNNSTIGLMCVGIGMRSRFLDEVLLKTLAGGEITTVLSLGAGLDARPYRLDLPAGLHWIEVDFEDMLDYKSAVLAGDRPRCRLERLAADLNDPAGRAAIFRATGERPALMITEGLLMYLPGGTIEALAAEAARTSIRRWILDLTSLPLAQQLHRDSSWDDIKAVRAEDHLDGGAILDTVARNGWAPSERRTYVVDGRPIVAARFKAMGITPPAGQDKMFPEDDPSGVHLFARA